MQTLEEKREYRRNYYHKHKEPRVYRVYTRDWQHGSRTGYAKHACRCSACSEANRIYRQIHGNLKRERMVEFINSLKDKPCVDCDVKYPFYVMDFDHVPERGDKLHSISAMPKYAESTEEKLLAEIAKCDLVCANCHRIRTYNRQHK